MKLRLNLCLLASLCFVSAAAHASYLTDAQSVSVSLNPARIVAYDIFKYCKQKKSDCAVTFIGVNGTPRYQQRMHNMPAYSLTEAEGNAAVALAFQTNLHVLGKGDDLKGLYLTEKKALKGVYFSVLGQVISGNPHYRATDGGSILVINGRSMGAVGVAVSKNSAVSGYALTKYIQKDLAHLYADHAYLISRETALIKESKKVTHNIDDALLFSTLSSGKLCHHLGIPCSVSVVNQSGSLLVSFLQDKSRPENQVLSHARAVASGATGLKYEARRSEKIRVIEQNLIGYRFISARPMMAIMPGTAPLNIEGVSVGGVGFAGNLSHSSPVDWGSYHHLIATSVNKYLSNHYQFPQSTKLSAPVKHRALVVLLNH